MDCHEVTSWDAEDHRLILHRDKMPACDVLGISATTANVHWGREMAAEWPAKYKVLGGTHATYILRGPHEQFKTPAYFAGFDFVMIEECEESFIAFCDAADRGDPKQQLIPPVPDLCWFTPSGSCTRTRTWDCRTCRN